VRISTDPVNINKGWFDIKLATWHDTKIWSATSSFIAFIPSVKSAIKPITAVQNSPVQLHAPFSIPRTSNEPLYHYSTVPQLPTNQLPKLSPGQIPQQPLLKTYPLTIPLNPSFTQTPPKLDSINSPMISALKPQSQVSPIANHTPITKVDKKEKEKKKKKRRKKQKKNW